MRRSPGDSYANLTTRALTCPHRCAGSHRKQSVTRKKNNLYNCGGKIHFQNILCHILILKKKRSNYVAVSHFLTKSVTKIRAKSVIKLRNCDSIDFARSPVLCRHCKISIVSNFELISELINFEILLFRFRIGLLNFKKIEFRIRL